MSFEELAKDLATGNMGGAQKTITFGRWADVATWPIPSAVVGHEGESTGDVELVDGASAFHVVCTEETVDVKINVVGEQDGRSQESILAFFTPKVRAKLLNFLNAIQNEEVFFIVPDNNGVTYLLGDAQRGANIVTGEATTGTKFTDRNGAATTFKYSAKKTLAYTGIDPADVVVGP